MRIEEPRAEFYVKAPTKDRASFAVMKRYRSKGRTETLKLSEVASINDQYDKKILSEAEARKALRNVLEKLRKEESRKYPQLTFHKANLRLLEEYWRNVYSNRQHRDPQSCKNRLLRAVRAVGDLALVSASASELQEAINRSASDGVARRSGPGINQREVVSALNQLLKYLGRTDIKLSRWHKETSDIRHLNLEDFEKMASQLPTRFLKVIARVAFSTGCRIGEVFALTSNSFDLKRRTVFVKNQMLRNGKLSHTKNRRQRRVRVLDQGIPWLKEWFDIPENEKQAMRNFQFAGAIRKACTKAFPKEPSKRCTFHDLRHSFAIHLLGLEVPLDYVARSLGDSVQVCQEYYVGYTLHDEGIETISRILQKA